MTDQLFEIIYDPNPALRMPTEKVKVFDMSFQQTIDKMVRTMRKANGIGLAAPQVGILQKLIIVENEYDKDNKENDNFPLTIIINPKISHFSKKECRMVEGCLSFPDMTTQIKRPENITICGQDRWGKPLSINASGLLSRALQHEFDHLEGVLLIDRVVKLKTVLMSGMELGLPTLKILASHPQFNTLALICNKNCDIDHSPINMINEAKKLKVPVIIWTNEDNIYNKLKDLKPDIIIVAGFGKIISDKIFNLPKFQTLNIHPSLLPLYRGPSPIQFTLLNGEKSTGVSIIKLAKEVDAGPILGKIAVKLAGNEDYNLILEALSTLGAELLADLVPYYITGQSELEVQDHSKATFTKIIKKEDGRILKEDTAEMIDRKIRAFRSWPIAYTFAGDKRVQILSASLNEENKLVINEVRPEGKRTMSYQDFQRGYKHSLKNFDGKIATN